MRTQEHDMLLPLDHMHGIKSNILDQTGKRIARCDFDGEMCAEADANAAYIIKCVNDRESLQAENQQLRDRLRKSTELLRDPSLLIFRTFRVDGYWRTLLTNQIAANEAALAKGSKW